MDQNQQQKRVLSAEEPSPPAKMREPEPASAPEVHEPDRTSGPVKVLAPDVDVPRGAAKSAKRQPEVVTLSRPPETPKEQISWIPAVIGVTAVVACAIATTIVIVSSQPASPSPTSPAPTLTTPRANLRHGDDDARRGYLERIAQHPDDSEAWTGLGNLQRRSGQLGDARRSYTRAIENNDRFFPAALAMADMAWDEGDRANAQKQYAALVANFPSGILPARVLERTHDTP